MTHICVGNLTIIGSDNGLSPDRHQAIIWTNAGLLLIGPLGTNFSELSIEILTLSFKKMRLKVSSAKRRPFCLGLNVLTEQFGQVSALLTLCEGRLHRSRRIHWWQVDSPSKRPIMRTAFPCHDFIMEWHNYVQNDYPFIAIFPRVVAHET